MSEVVWGIFISLYPFLSGLAAGSFTLYVISRFFRKELENLSKFSLIVSWAMLLVVSLPLVFDLGQPTRAINIFLYPHMTSAMAMFGYLWLSFFILVTALIVIHTKYRAESWFKSATKTLGWIGVIFAILLPGYVGFIFGTLKKIPLWHSAIIPVSFIISAVVSGTALVALLYTIIWRSSKLEIRSEVLNSLGILMLWFLGIDIFLQVLEVVSKAYTNVEGWYAVSSVLMGPLFFSFVGVQMIIGGILPLIALLTEKVRKSIEGVAVSSFLILVGVFAFRWNLVVGGQLVKEASPYFYTIISYSADVSEILGVIGILVLWAFLFVLGLIIFPNWKMVVSGNE